VSTKGLTIGFFIADAVLIALCAFFYLQMDRTAPVITLPDTEQTYTTGTNTHQLLEDGKRFAALFKTQYLYMMYVWGHSFEFTCEADWEQMERFCDLVAGREDTWYATNIEIVDYLEDARRLQFTVAADIVHNPAARSIWIEVDGDRIEIPGGATVQLS